MTTITKTFVSVRLRQWIYEEEKGEDSGEDFDFHDSFDVDVEVTDEKVGIETFNELVALLEKKFGRDKVNA